MSSPRTLSRRTKRQLLKVASQFKPAKTRNFVNKHGINPTAAYNYGVEVYNDDQLDETEYRKGLALADHMHQFKPERGGKRRKGGCGCMTRRRR